MGGTTLHAVHSAKAEVPSAGKRAPLQRPKPVGRVHPPRSRLHEGLIPHLDDDLGEALTALLDTGTRRVPLLAASAKGTGALDLT